MLIRDLKSQNKSTEYRLTNPLRAPAPN